MKSWLLRGLAFAFLMIVVRLVQGALINIWETQAGVISVVLVVIFALVGFFWGVLDGRADANAQPDPDRRADLAMTWLLAGLLAGVVAGGVCWLISLFYSDIYAAALMSELTTFAAFTALLLFVFSIVGVTIGRWLVDRKADGQPRRRATGDDDSTDTDVFAAVGAQRGSSDSGATQAAPTQVASSGEQRTEVIQTRDQPTEVIQTRDQPTEVISRQQDAKTEEVTLDKGRTEAMPTRPVQTSKDKEPGAGS